MNIFFNRQDHARVVFYFLRLEDLYEAHRQLSREVFLLNLRQTETMRTRRRADSQSNTKDINRQFDELRGLLFRLNPELKDHESSVADEVAKKERTEGETLKVPQDDDQALSDVEVEDVDFGHPGGLQRADTTIHFRLVVPKRQIWQQ